MRHARRIACAAGLASGLSIATPARADHDPWLGRDKALHFGVSGAIAAGAYAGSTLFVDARGPSLAIGGGVGLAAGIAKETLDLAGYGDPSWKDLAWDGIGVVAGLALAYGVDLLIRGTPPEYPWVGARF